MRSWQIILASAVVAIIADGVLFLPGALPWRPGSAALLLAHWPTIAAVWLGVYGAAALGVTTLVVFLEIRGGAAPVRFGGDRARRYVVRLAATHYFTCLLCLFGLGLSPLPIETAPFRFLPTPISGTPALAVCGALAVGGLLGGLFLAAVLVRTESPRPESPAPGIRAGRLLPKVSEPAAASPNVAADAAPIAELIEREQRPVLEAIRELATAVNRLRRDLRHGLGEIKAALDDRRSGQSSEAGSAAPEAAEHAATELRAAVAAVDTSVARLAEMASLIAAHEALVVAGRDAPLSPALRPDLSSELQALLRDMTPATGKTDPPG